MEAAIARIVASINDWDALKQFEKNAQDRNRLDQELSAALKARGVQLARALIAEKTGLDVSDLSPAEEKIVQAVGEYVSIMRRQGKYPQRTFEQLRNRGLIEAAESAVSQPRPTQGFQALAEADLEDLSYEQIVIDHADEFSPRALWFSRRTLGLPTSVDSPPADTHGDTQSRTASFISWLKDSALANDGVIPEFTNQDAAVAMNMADMQRFGQVHGNIQSRVDFACYACGLPPLGLAADAPFTRAWSQEGRDWAFPVASMQRAAQWRIWTAEDFDRVQRHTEQLPGQAHVVWKDALARDEQGIKAWAFSFVDTDEVQDEETIEGDTRRQRNPRWTREELILALDLYMRHRDTLPSKDSEPVVELSDLLNQIGLTASREASATYRNPNGVYMKLGNFRRLDPLYIADGKVGLSRGNKDEQVVWDTFAHDPDRLAAIVKAIRMAVASAEKREDLGGPDEPDITEAEEGRVLTRLHRVRERSRKLVEAAKARAINEHGRLFCVACGFDFTSTYGDIGAGLIDVHHTKPVHTLGEGEITKIEDLALLCANCHRVVHSSRRWLSVEEVRNAFQSTGRSASA